MSLKWPRFCNSKWRWWKPEEMIGCCYCSKQDICRFAVFWLTPWKGPLHKYLFNYMHLKIPFLLPIFVYWCHDCHKLHKYCHQYCLKVSINWSLKWRNSKSWLPKNILHKIICLKFPKLFSSSFNMMKDKTPDNLNKKLHWFCFLECYLYRNLPLKHNYWFAKCLSLPWLRERV